MTSKQSIDRHRRAFLRVSGMAALLAFAAQRAPALAQARSGGTAIKIGIVGSGKLGGTVREAIAFGEVVLIAVPYGALPQIGREHAGALSGKIVIDACNPIAARDGEIAQEAMANGIGPTSLKYLSGTRLVRAFDPVPYRNFEGDAPRGGEKIGMPVAGDDAEAVKIASQLARDAGAEPVALPLSRAMDFAPGTPLFGKAFPVSELRKRLGMTQ